jgi:acyl carrier protein
MTPELSERAVLLDEVRALVVERLRLSRLPHQVDPDAPLFGAGLGLDSVDAVELVVAIEERLGVDLPDGVHARVVLRTPNRIVDHVLAMRNRE